jgi:hypothetical protein
VQKAFEELIYSALGPSSWQPTHVSPSAVQAGVEGWGGKLPLQRAHGLLGRMDRFGRTTSLMGGAEQPLEAWWPFFCDHDRTVIVTRGEHGSGWQPTVGQLIPLPPPEEGLFRSQGVGFRLSRRGEGEWLLGAWRAMGSPGTPSPALVR